MKKRAATAFGIPEEKQPGGGRRTPLDQAHRISFDQLSKLGGQYGPSGLGIDPFRLNREDIKAIENSIKPLYAEQVKLFNKAKKLDSIPLNLKRQIDTNNNKIAEVMAKKTDGRLHGTQVNYSNLKIESTPIDYGKVVGQGVVETPLSKIKPGSMDDITVRLNLIEQIKKEGAAYLGKEVDELPNLFEGPQAQKTCQLLFGRVKNAKGPGCGDQVREALQKDSDGFLKKVARNFLHKEVL